MMHIMIDLETLGVTPTAPVIAIGACRFDGAGVYDTFYANISLEEECKRGAIIEPGTTKWWIAQGTMARDALFQDEVSPQRGLDHFRQWALSEGPGPIWGNGAAFDNAILNAMARRHLGAPITDHTLDRCYRTVRNLFPQAPRPLRLGTHHHALTDAIYQAKHLIEICRATGLDLLDETAE